MTSESPMLLAKQEFDSLSLSFIDVMKYLKGFNQISRERYFKY